MNSFRFASFRFIEHTIQKNDLQKHFCFQKSSYYATSRFMLTACLLQYLAVLLILLLRNLK